MSPLRRALALPPQTFLTGRALALLHRIAKDNAKLMQVLAHQATLLVPCRHDGRWVCEAHVERVARALGWRQ